MTANRLSTYSRKTLHEFQLHFHDDAIDDQTYCVASEKMSLLCYWRGKTIHIFSLNTGIQLVSWTFYRLIDVPCVIRCVEPVLLGNKPHVACSLSLLEESASLIYLLDVTSGFMTRVIRVAQEVTAMILLTGPHERIETPVVVHFVGTLAVGCRGGYTFLIDLALDEKIKSGESHPLIVETIRSHDDSSSSRRRAAAARHVVHGVCLDDAVVSWGKFRHKKTNGDVWVSLDSTAVHVSCMTFLRRLGLLAVGFSFGSIQLWNMRRLLAEYSMAYDRSRGPVDSITYQEPEDDPKNFVYLWLGRQGVDEASSAVVSLLQLGFSRCHRSGHSKSDKGSNSKRYIHPVYECLTSASVRFQQPLKASAGSVDADRPSSSLFQSSCVPLSRPSSGGVSMCLMAFMWREGHRNFLSLFDLDRWYHAQMPTCVPATGQRRPGVPQAVWDLCPFFCTYELGGETPRSPSVLYGLLLQQSVARWRSTLVMEQSFYPSALTFEVLSFTERETVQHVVMGMQDLLVLNLLRWASDVSTCARVDDMSAQCRELLSRCLVSGLITREDLPPSGVGPSSFPIRNLLDVFLDHDLHSSLVQLLFQTLPGGRLAEHGFTLTELVEWLWGRVEGLKKRLDSLTVQLYDLSGVELDTFQMAALTAVLKRLTGAEQIFYEALGKVEEIGAEGRGRVVGDLHIRWSAVKLVVIYARAVEWMVKKKILPEREEGALRGGVLESMRRFWEERRKNNDSRLLVDRLVELSGGASLRRSWAVYSESENAIYPPPSLQALLCGFLVTDEEEGATLYKHWLLVYFLLDLDDQSRSPEGDSHGQETPNKLASSKTAAPVELWEEYCSVFSLPPAVLLTIRLMWSIDHGLWEDVERMLGLLGQVRRACFPNQHQSVLEKLRSEGQHILAQRYFTLFISGGLVHPTEDQEALLYVRVQLCPPGRRRISSVVDFVRRFRDHLPDIARQAWWEICRACLDSGQMGKLFELLLRPVEERWMEEFLLENRRDELLVLYHLGRRDIASALKMKKKNGALLEDRTTGVHLLTELYLKSLPTLHRRILEQPSVAWAPSGAASREVEPKLMPLSLVMARHKEKIGLSSCTTMLRSVAAQLETKRALDRELFEEYCEKERHPSAILISAQKSMQSLGSDFKRKRRDSRGPVLVPTPIKQRIQDADISHAFFSPSSALPKPYKSPGPKPLPAVPRRLPEFVQEVLRTPPVSRKKDRPSRSKPSLPTRPSILKSDSNVSQRCPTPAKEEVRFSQRLVGPRGKDSGGKIELETSFNVPSLAREPLSNRIHALNSVSDEEEDDEESPDNFLESHVMDTDKESETSEVLETSDHEANPDSQVSSQPIIMRREFRDVLDSEPFSFSPPRTRQKGRELPGLKAEPFSFSPPRTRQADALPEMEAEPFSSPTRTQRADKPPEVEAEPFSFSPPKALEEGRELPDRDSETFSFSPPKTRQAKKQPEMEVEEPFSFSPPKTLEGGRELPNRDSETFSFSPPKTRQAEKRPEMEVDEPFSFSPPKTLERGRELPDRDSETFSFSPPRTRPTGGHLAAGGDNRSNSHLFFTPPVSRHHEPSTTEFNFSPPRLPSSEIPRGNNDTKSGKKFIFSPPVTRSGLRRGLSKEQQRRLAEEEEELRQKSLHELILDQERALEATRKETEALRKEQEALLKKVAEDANKKQQDRLRKEEQQLKEKEALRKKEEQERLKEEMRKREEHERIEEELRKKEEQQRKEAEELRTKEEQERLKEEMRKKEEHERLKKELKKKEEQQRKEAEELRTKEEQERLKEELRKKEEHERLKKELRTKEEQRRKERESRNKEQQRKERELRRKDEQQRKERELRKREERRLAEEEEEMKAQEIVLDRRITRQQRKKEVEDVQKKEVESVQKKEVESVVKKKEADLVQKKEELEVDYTPRRILRSHKTKT